MSGYYRDIKDQPALVRFTNLNGLVDYSVNLPHNYRDTRGLEVTLSKDRGRWIRGFVNYTYMVTKGGNFGFQRFYENRADQATFERETRSHYQSRRVPEPFGRFSLEILPPRDFGPQLGGHRLFGDMRLSLLGEWRSGQISTWSGPGGAILGLENNVQWKDYYNLDLRLSKNVETRLGKAQLFADATNVLNHRQLNRSAPFIGSNDFAQYMMSLHLHEDTFVDIDQPPYDFIPGNDRPGDYRKAGVQFVPIEIVSSLPQSGMQRAAPHEGPLYYNRQTQQYFVWNGNAWAEADQAFVTRVLDDKAYIDMPNFTPFHFFNPRNISFGIRITL